MEESRPPYPSDQMQEDGHNGLLRNAIGGEGGAGRLAVIRDYDQSTYQGLKLSVRRWMILEGG